MLVLLAAGAVAAFPSRRQIAEIGGSTFLCPSGASACPPGDILVSTPLTSYLKLNTGENSVQESYWYVCRRGF